MSYEIDYCLDRKCHSHKGTHAIKSNSIPISIRNFLIYLLYLIMSEI